MNYIIVECSNSFSGEVKFNRKNELISSKNGDHGYGTKIIKNVVNKYNGTLDYEVNDNKFIITIMFQK